ncbi:hypothetical protein Dimus_009900 [Dionaea muscipula]
MATTTTCADVFSQDMIPYDLGLTEKLLEEYMSFDHLIDLIREDDYDPITYGKLEQNQLASNQQDMNNGFIDFNYSCTTTSNYLDSPSPNGGSCRETNDHQVEDQDIYPAPAAMSTNEISTASNKARSVDRSRSLVSERRRRGRMKDKLYALRALVPNITKMDKASIVGDAVLYVQEMQMQAKKLREEIAHLESSAKAVVDRCRTRAGPTHDQSSSIKISINPVDHSSSSAGAVIPPPRLIMQMKVFQVEERGFFARVVSSKGQGVAALLYKALESLGDFTVIESSNLTMAFDTFILTSTVMVCQCHELASYLNFKNMSKKKGRRTPTSHT